MFTGIIEATGKIISIENNGTNKTFWIESPDSTELNIDESISHDGICLTVEEVKNNSHRVTAIEETIKKTTIGNWAEGNTINLERSMQMNDRIDGHMVQGHVDTTAACIDKKVLDGSWEFTFSFDKKFATLLIEKGSVCINGVSLTAFNVKQKKFTVAIIPYTFNHTNFSFLEPGAFVNIEFDMIGKYVARIAKFK